MNKFRRLSVPIAVSAALLAAASGVQAGAIGTGQLDITSLLFTNSAGGTITLGVDITPSGTGLLNNGDTFASLTGEADDSLSNDQVVDGSDFDMLTPGYSCVGDCAYTNNSFTHLIKPSDLPGGSYVVNDLFLTGTSIQLPGQPVTTGANAEIMAESAVAPNDVGSAEGNVGLNASFVFIANADDTLNFDFNYDAYLRAALLDVDGVTANASIGWTLSLVDETDDTLLPYNFDISMDEDWLLSSVSALNPGQDREFAWSGTGSGSATLIEDHTYSLTITHEALADSEAIVAVPAPAPLALVGLGLLAFGLKRGNKKV